MSLVIRLRKNRIALLVVTALVFVVVGCTSNTKKDAQETKSEASELILASISPPKSFNPVTAKETSTTQITGLLDEGLTQVNGTSGEVEPALAKSWETKKNGRKWVFHLRDDLQWSDGHPITADDVVFSYKELYLNPKIETSARSILYMDGQAPTVTKTGELTVVFEYPEPYAPFARVAGQAIMPEHVFGEMPENEFNSSLQVGINPDSIVVNGPFQLGRYETSQRVVLKRNPQYYATGPNGESRPYLDRIKFEIINSTQVVVQRFLKGKIDAINVQPTYFPLVKSNHDKSTFSISRPGYQMGTLFLAFNMNTDDNPNTGETYIPEYKLNWFNDSNFRRAVSHGIDRTSIIEIVYNSLGKPQYGPVSPGNKMFYNSNLEKFPHDTEKAKKILDENGYTHSDDDGVREGPNGNDISLTLITNSGNDQRVEMAEIIRQDLDNLGFDVNFNQIEFNTLVSKLNANYDWEAVVIGFTGGLEPHFGSNLWKSSGDLHLWHPKQEKPAREWEAEIDKIFQQAVKQTDQQKRKELYSRWQRIVNKQQSVIYTVTGESIYAVHNHVKNMKPTAIGGMLHNVEKIRLK